jgi:hypothetical protein
LQHCGLSYKLVLAGGTNDLNKVLTAQNTHKHELFAKSNIVVEFPLLLFSLLL